MLNKYGMRMRDFFFFIYFSFSLQSGGVLMKQLFYSGSCSICARWTEMIITNSWPSLASEIIVNKGTSGFQLSVVKPKPNQLLTN